MPSPQRRAARGGAGTRIRDNKRPHHDGAARCRGFTRLPGRPKAGPADEI